VSGDTVTLLSYHGKYVSAQPNGQLMADRKRAQGWEEFKIEDGNNPPPVNASLSSSTTRRVSDTDYAMILASQSPIGLRGYHGCYVSANATCKERTMEGSEAIVVVMLNHNLVALRSRFGKYLSG
jgi:hypothetical protein